MPERAVRAGAFRRRPPRGRSASEEPAAGMPPTAIGWPERPIRLFRRPEPVEVPATEVPEGPPHDFRWRRALHRVAARGRSRAHRAGMVARAGRTTPTRDYFRVEDERRPPLLALPRRAFTAPPKRRRAGSCMGFSHERAWPPSAYAEFAVQSNFSFLRGASSRRSWR